MNRTDWIVLKRFIKAVTVVFFVHICSFIMLVEIEFFDKLQILAILYLSMPLFFSIMVHGVIKMDKELAPDKASNGINISQGFLLFLSSSMLVIVIDFYLLLIGNLRILCIYNIFAMIFFILSYIYANYKLKRCDLP